MLIDLHTHLMRYDTDMLPPLKSDLERCGLENKWRYNEDGYKAATAGADVRAVFCIRARKTGWNGDNDYVADFVSRQGGGYVFFASVDPADEDYMDHLTYAHATLHAKGVKLGPVYQGVHPLDRRNLDIYAYCEKHGLPVITHMATTFSSGVPLEYARPIHMDEVACRYPGLKIVLAHLGHPWEVETIAVIRKQPNVYADISALYYRPLQFYFSMRLLEEYRTDNKVFFGSDFPACTTADSIEGVKHVNDAVQGCLPPVSASLIDGILHRNPLEALNIRY